MAHHRPFGPPVIRAQYHFRRVGCHVHAWDVRRLLALAQDTPVTQVALADIAEADQPYWFDVPPTLPTCRAIMAHAAQVAAADLTFPILLCTQGRMIDGMHRTMKALSLDHTTIAACHIALPRPDHIDPDPASLPYD